MARMPVGYQLGLQMALECICIMTLNDLTCSLPRLSCDLEFSYVLASRSTFPARATSWGLQPPTLHIHANTTDSNTRIPQKVNWTSTMGSKEATIASFVESAPPGEVGRSDACLEEHTNS